MVFTYITVYGGGKKKVAILLQGFGMLLLYRQYVKYCPVL